MVRTLFKLLLLGAAVYCAYKFTVKHLNISWFKDFLLKNKLTHILITKISGQPLKSMVKKAKRYKIEAITNNKKKVEILAEHYDPEIHEQLLIRR